MYISGTDIVTYRARIKPNFRTRTTLALKWIKLSSGLYKATDRGASSDIYESEFRIYAKEEEVNQFIEAWYDNRSVSSTNVFTLSGFESTEHIFGEDVDHSVPIDVTILEISDIKQGKWKTREITVKVRALSPSFVGTPSLPTLECLEIGYTISLDQTINKFDTYNGSFTYQDYNADVGELVGIFNFSVEDMKSIRRYFTTQRDATISIPNILGVEYPFGPYRNSTYPIDVKIIAWEDLGLWGINKRRMKITMAEVV